MGKLLHYAFLPIVDEMHQTWKRMLPHFVTGRLQIEKNREIIDYDGLPENLELLLQDVDLEGINEIRAYFDLRRMKKALPQEITNSMYVNFEFTAQDAYLSYYFNDEQQKKLFYGDEVIEESFRQEVRPLITQWVMRFNEELENLKH